MRILLALAALLLLPLSASAEPWVISGQTRINAGTAVDNPPPADAGAIGQVTALPYTVPAGKVVCVHAYGMEGYDDTGIAVIFMFTGDPPVIDSQWRIDHGLPSAAADSGSQEITGMNFCFPGGTVLNVRLINGQAGSWVYGWYVSGELLDAAEFD